VSRGERSQSLGVWDECETVEAAGAGGVEAPCGGVGRRGEEVVLERAEEPGSEGEAAAEGEKPAAKGAEKTTEKAEKPEKPEKKEKK